MDKGKSNPSSNPFSWDILVRLLSTYEAGVNLNYISKNKGLTDLKVLDILEWRNGRRDWLKPNCRKACEFKSHFEYQYAGVMELVDIAVLEAAASCVWVRVPLSAPMRR